MHIFNYATPWRIENMIIYKTPTPVVILEYPDCEYYVLSSFLHEYQRKCRRPILQCAHITPLIIDVDIIKAGRNNKIKTVQQRVILRKDLPALISALQSHCYNCYVCTDEEGVRKPTKKVKSSQSPAIAQSSAIDEST